MRFSIIIPVYNVEKYIRKCMQTVMDQTFRDYEVIVVDDETPDNSMAIVEAFAERYPGVIKIIHQKNTRQGGARNRGVQEAKGEYILFVDSDDYVRCDMLAIIDRALDAQDCDVLCYRYKMVTPEGKFLREEGFGPLLPGKYTPEENKEILLLPVGPVLKAFRRSFYLESGVMFPEKVLYEDTVGYTILAQAESVYLLDEALYYYVQSSNSSIRQKPSDKMLDILTVTDLVLEQFRQKGLYDTFREPLEISLIYGITYILDVINETDKENALQYEMTSYMAEHFPDYKTNPYLDATLEKGMSYLMKNDFITYHFRVLQVTKLKDWLLQWRLIAQLNRLRHKLKRKSFSIFHESK